MKDLQELDSYCAEMGLMFWHVLVLQKFNQADLIGRNLDKMEESDFTVDFISTGCRGAG